MTSTDLDAPTPPEAPPRGVSGLLGRFTSWQRALLVGSLALMVVGVALRGYAAVTSGDDDARNQPAAAVDGGGDPLRPSGFVASGDPVPADDDVSDAAAETDGLKGWSPVIFRLGFSFFVGFSIAYAVRAFVKLAIISIGIQLLVLFGLEYAGLIEVQWDLMEVSYDRIVAWLGDQTAGFGAFIRGALPSAAMGGLGLVVGFRRRS